MTVTPLVGSGHARSAAATHTHRRDVIYDVLHRLHFAHDLTGNVRGLMDSSGLAAHTDYTPYGERITYGPGHARTSLGY
ncbi:MAG: hypothetical protein AAFV33_18495, partial [Chloroflexota bacterium]